MLIGPAIRRPRSDEISEFKNVHSMQIRLRIFEKTESYTSVSGRLGKQKSRCGDVGRQYCYRQ